MVGVGGEASTDQRGQPKCSQPSSSRSPSQRRSPTRCAAGGGTAPSPAARTTPATPPPQGPARTPCSTPSSYARTSGGELARSSSSEYLPLARSLPASGYSPVKQASQCVARVAPTASYTPASDR